MTEAEAQDWLADRFGPLAVDRLRVLATLVTDEATRQNLISRSTVEHVWTRHLVDSAQLLTLPDIPSGQWVDVGTGAGFPGLVIAILRPQPVLLVEPRRKRAVFLEAAREALGLSNATVHCGRIEQVKSPATVISARAVASIDALFMAALPCAEDDTLWLLPKGRSALEEVALARRSWQAVFHVEQSLTDPDARIVTARKVAHR